MLITKEKAVSMITQVNSTTIGKFVPTIPNCFNFEDLMLASTAVHDSIQTIQHVTNCVMITTEFGMGLVRFEAKKGRPKLSKRVQYAHLSQE